jgi:ribosomal protein L10
MSKFVKDMLTKDLASRLEGVEDCILANVIGIESNATTALRAQLREKGIKLMVIKNSLAQRATEGTSLAPAFEGLTGTAAIVWGASDFVSLVKEVTALDKEDEGDLEKFKAIGGVLDGEKLTPEKVKEISKWPTREEQLSMLVGQILGPGSQLVAQLKGPGSQLAGQFKAMADKEE